MARDMGTIHDKASLMLQEQISTTPDSWEPSKDENCGNIEDVQSLMRRAAEFSSVLADAKAAPLEQALNWYPYDTMASLGHLSTILESNFANFRRAMTAGPLIDLGCGDGDLSLFFASLKQRVTAVDNPPTNYNRMRGVKALSVRLQLPIEVLERDVDSQFLIPEQTYGLALSLGILYHLKNPFYFLEKLAATARYCVLSTRVARETRNGTKMGPEALAYLLDDREANNDATNYWIFSPVALRRLTRRAGWALLGEAIVGCADDSNPVDSDKDARMFLFLQSRRLSIPAEIQLLQGWTDVTEFDWAWTLKRFSFQAHIFEDIVEVLIGICRGRPNGCGVASYDILHGQRNSGRATDFSAVRQSDVRSDDTWGYLRRRDASFRLRRRT